MSFLNRQLDESINVNTEGRSDGKLTKLFGLPVDQVKLKDEKCSTKVAKLKLQGIIYLFSHFLCFYGPSFGFKTKLSLPLDHISHASVEGSEFTITEKKKKVPFLMTHSRISDSFLEDPQVPFPKPRFSFKVSQFIC